MRIKRSRVLSVVAMSVAAAMVRPAMGVSYSITQVGPTGTQFNGTSGGQYDPTASIVGSGIAANGIGDIVGIADINPTTGSGSLSTNGSSAFYFAPGASASTIIDLAGTGMSTGVAGTTYIDSGANKQGNVVSVFLGTSGVAAGTNSIYTTAGTQSGGDAFYYTPSSGTVLIPYLNVPGAVDTAYTNVPTFHNSVASGVTSDGYVIGVETQYNTTVTTFPSQVGTAAYLYNPASPSAATAITVAGTTAHTSSNNTAGISAPSFTVKSVVGQYVLASAQAYTSAGASLGQDTVVLNTAGANTVATAVNPLGTINGVNYTADGTLTGTRNSTPYKVTSTGLVEGTASRYNASGGGSNGTDVFFFNGTTTSIVGLDTGAYLGASGATEASAGYLSNNGIVGGTSVNYTVGNSTTDAWIAKNGNTVRVGLTGGVYQAPSTSTFAGYRATAVATMGSGGVLGGTSPRYDQVNNYTQVGQDAWVANGNTIDTTNATAGTAGTVEVGLNSDTGFNQSYYQAVLSGNTTPTRYSAVSFVNATGQAAGISYRYNSSGGKVGQDGFLYDPGTSKDYAINLSTSSDGVTDNTTVSYLSDSGVVLGTYTEYSGATALPGTFGYAFELLNGTPTAFDLGQVTSNLTTAGWAQLYNGLTMDNAGDIIGIGELSSYGGNAGLTNPSTTAFVLTPTAVPEPASIGLLAIGGLAMLGRRRRA